MKITIERKYKKKHYTIGNLFVDGVWVCNTMEPHDRGFKQTMYEKDIFEQKVWGETAIPTGTYKVKMQWSQKFQDPRPFLSLVKGFNGIMIHEGNTVSNTQGCILVGYNTRVAMLKESRKALTIIIDLIKEAERAGEPVMLTVR